ncbi:MAG: glycosyltransferase [Bacteroidota bacterium]
MVTNQKTAVVSIINSIHTDARVQKTCKELFLAGFEVIVIDRKIESLGFQTTYNFKLISLQFFINTGVLFYFCYQVKLFFKLLSLRPNLLFSNDLDTLFPNYLVSKIKNVPLIYDSHELFTEVPELQNKRLKKGCWKMLESFLIPRLKHLITVNNSIANVYKSIYDKDFKVVRNIPDNKIPEKLKTRKELGLPEDKFIVILQGAGINIDRGAEELIESFKLLDDRFFLLIIGSGDVWQKLVELCLDEKLKTKTKLIERLPKNELMQYTFNATIGVSIDKSTNLNYYNSLPNKVFDYANAGLPILASNIPEIAFLVNKYQVGLVITSHEPSEIAKGISEMVSSAHFMEWKENYKKLILENNWEIESKVLKAIIKDAAN